MKRFSQTTLFLLFLALLASCQRSGENTERIAKKVNKENFETKTSEATANFVVETIAEAYANVRYAQLASDRSESASVKEIATAIEKDHTMLVRELKALAALKGITIPLEETPQARRRLEDLSKSGDEKFDGRWCEDLSQRHEDIIQSLEEMWEDTSDEELKTWINSALPGLRSCLVKLKTCREKLTS